MGHTKSKQLNNANNSSTKMKIFAGNSVLMDINIIFNLSIITNLCSLH